MPSRRQRWWSPSDPWSLAAALFLFGGAVLLVVAWYDISGTADLYKQMPYLVSAGFSGLALIIVGSACLIAGRNDRVERRIAQLVDAITEVAPAPAGLRQEGTVHPPEAFVVAAGGRTYHRPDCLLLRGKQVSAADAGDVRSGVLSPCPVCGPSQPE